MAEHFDNFSFLDSMESTRSTRRSLRRLSRYPKGYVDPGADGTKDALSFLSHDREQQTKKIAVPVMPSAASGKSPGNEGGKRSPRKKGLTVSFVSTAPEFIGYGGDECDEPSIEVRHRREESISYVHNLHTTLRTRDTGTNAKGSQASSKSSPTPAESISGMLTVVTTLKAIIKKTTIIIREAGVVDASSENLLRALLDLYRMVKVVESTLKNSSIPAHFFAYETRSLSKCCSRLQQIQSMIQDLFWQPNKPREKTGWKIPLYKEKTKLIKAIKDIDSFNNELGNDLAQLSWLMLQDSIQSQREDVPGNILLGLDHVPEVSQLSRAMTDEETIFDPKPIPPTTSQIIKDPKYSASFPESSISSSDEHKSELVADEKSRRVLFRHILSNEDIETRLETITVFLRQHPRSSIVVNSKDEIGRTPLHMTARRGDVRIAELLLNYSADINARDSEPSSVLDFAVYFNHEKFVEFLLDHDVDATLISKQNSQRFQEMSEAIELRKSKASSRSKRGSWLKLLKSKSTTDKTKSGQRSGKETTVDDSASLCDAISKGEWNKAKLLIERKNINLNLHDVWGLTPLLHATFQGNRDLVLRLLNKNADPNLKGHQGRTALMAAVDLGSTIMVKTLLGVPTIDVNLRDDNGEDALSKAVAIGKGKLVHLLLESSAINVNSQDDRGQTPLFKAIQSGNYGVTELFLQRHDINPNIPNHVGCTPLIKAVEQGSRAMVKLLLQNDKIDVDKQDKRGRSALAVAVFHNDLTLVKLLLDSKADATLRDSAGMTPLDYAESSSFNDIPKLLLDHSVRNKTRNTNVDTAMSVASSLGEGASERIGRETNDAEYTQSSFGYRNAKGKKKRVNENEHLLPALEEESSAEDELVVRSKQVVVSLADTFDPDTDEPHISTGSSIPVSTEDWKAIREQLLPLSWVWDVDFHSVHTTSGMGRPCLTCTPIDADDPKNFPLTISGVPVVLPVEYQWPPSAGVNPPPDPRPSTPIDCTTNLPIEVVRDIFLTFEGSVGFYSLLDGHLQIIVRDDFDTAWASSHLPHKYGGLKVCYIPQNMEATMLPTKTETAKSKSSFLSHGSSIYNRLKQVRNSNATTSQPLRLNDFIEARAKLSRRKEKFAGRIGLKITKDGSPYLIMSTHVITEAILAKSHRWNRFGKLDEDWNDHVDIWAGDKKIGDIHQNFDPEAEIYPNGFPHDITIIKPKNPSTTKDIRSPIPDLGWLSHSSWACLRQQTSRVKILQSPESKQKSAKTLKTSRPSEVLVVGEGIFLNQTSAAGSSKSLKDHDISTWKDLVSRALLYRVYPDFDPPNGYSGIALYADGTKEDGTEGPGIVGFQSFVQRSGHVQNFEMEGGALDKRLKLGRVAFYGAFEVPECVKREYGIV